MLTTLFITGLMLLVGVTVVLVALAFVHVALLTVQYAMFLWGKATKGR